jgi:hypothetical protein
MSKPAFNQDHLKHFRFKHLFNELGWDAPAQQQPFSVVVGDDTWLLDVVAIKKGVQVLHCRPDVQGRLPDYASRQKIERKITPDVREHLIVFTDEAQMVQIWQWVTRQTGRPAQYREVFFRKGETPELLTQKLSRLHFALDEEELLTVLGVTARLDDAAPRDKVTKKFYGDFEKQRKAFAAFIEGIPADSEDQRWYTAVVIDRLMFLWFLQEKGFLDNQRKYLQQRLQFHLDGNHTQSFYKRFLSPLFFKGFAQERTPETASAIQAEFGKVPYLNGGLFAQHELEERYGEALDIADNAFQKLFAFFDEWEWHLDERPLKSGKEINPDVLGYIFEKFVNQKQMGAYYTKEDITEYIGKNTIIPSLLGKVRAEHPAAFDALAWPLLQNSGDAYIYPAMLKGVDMPYPPEIYKGLDTAAPDLLARRKTWNKRADDAVSLPSEIWRETIARHQRTRELRPKLAAGELREVGDLITWNLNIRQFAQDLIESCTDVALLKSFWFNLAGRLPRKSNEKFRHGLSVLDPTCGSGAFLFAALNILKPLYDATLRTLQAVRADALMDVSASHPDKWAEVDELLARFAAAGSDRAQDYAVIKHIIVNNLYGVDIEKQATEIAKLRLFLKLVALLEPGDDIEPLPDIDFNIRHGNTLVGYATADETENAVKGATQGNLFSDAWEDIRIRLTAVEQQYNNFQIQQVQRGGHVSGADKQALTATLSELEEMLNYHLAREYGVNTTKTKDFDGWKKSHQPFHWYVDFYPLMAEGGFDAVIGNPPYVETSEVEDEYQPRGNELWTTGNLFSACTWRFARLLKPNGNFSVIVPISAVSTPRMWPLTEFIQKRFNEFWVSSYAVRPAKLFVGVDMNLSILTGSGTGLNTRRSNYSSQYLRWSSEQREGLFQTLGYLPNDKLTMKLGDSLASSIAKMVSTDKSFEQRALLSGLTLDEFIYVHSGGRYFRKCAFSRISNEYKPLRLPVSWRNAVAAALSSSTFYVLWLVVSDCYHITKRDIDALRLPADLLSSEAFGDLGIELLNDLQKNSVVSKRKRKDGTVQDEVSFKVGKSKDIIDRIDSAMAVFYGLSAEQLDFIVNYDIKYRMVQGMGGGDD